MSPDESNLSFGNKNTMNFQQAQGAVQKCQRFPLMRSRLIRGGEGVYKNVEIS